MSKELTEIEKNIVDDRVEYFFENNNYIPSSEELCDFVMVGGEIEETKLYHIKKYLEDNL